MRLRLRTKLALYISVPLIITYIITLGLDYIAQRQRATEFLQSLVIGRANLTAGILEGRLNQIQQIGHNLAGQFAQRNERVDPSMRMRLSAGLRTFDWAVGVVIAMEPDFAPPARRTLIVRNPPPGQPPPSPMPGELNGELDPTIYRQTWYAEVKRTHEQQWFYPAPNPVLFPQPTIVFASPIIMDGEFHGVVAVHITPNVFRWTREMPPPRKLLGGRNAQNPGAALAPPSSPSAPPQATSRPSTDLFNYNLDHYIIVDGQSNLVYQFPPTPRLPPNLDDPLFQAIAPGLGYAIDDAKTGQSGIANLHDVDREVFEFTPDENYWVAVSPIYKGKWILLSAFPEGGVMEPINRSIIQRIELLAIGLVLLLAIIWVVARRISRPIEVLEAASRKVGAGDLSTQVPQPHGGAAEVAQLSSHFNIMLQNLRAQMQKAREESAARSRVESELTLARQIQTDLLPRGLPNHPLASRFQLHAINLPANHVAGDFYDFFVDSQGKLTLVIADVSGHGVGAALMMAVTRTLLRNFSAEGLSPAEIAIRANHALLEDSNGSMFVTLILCTYDPATGDLHYVNAGHPPPVLLRADGSVAIPPESTAPLLGAFSYEHSEFRQACIRLKPGETLILYTDGIPEAMDAAHEQFGLRRFAEVLQKTPTAPLPDLCQHVIEAVQAHTQGPIGDDITLLMIRQA